MSLKPPLADGTQKSLQLQQLAADAQRSALMTSPQGTGPVGSLNQAHHGTMGAHPRLGNIF